MRLAEAPRDQSCETVTGFDVPSRWLETHPALRDLIQVPAPCVGLFEELTRAPPGRWWHSVQVALVPLSRRGADIDALAAGLNAQCRAKARQAFVSLVEQETETEEGPGVEWTSADEAFRVEIWLQHYTSTMISLVRADAVDINDALTAVDDSPLRDLRGLLALSTLTSLSCGRGVDDEPSWHLQASLGGASDAGRVRQELRCLGFARRGDVFLRDRLAVRASQEGTFWHAMLPAPGFLR